MKKIIFFLALITGLESSGQGSPFATYNDVGSGYYPEEALNFIRQDLVLVNTYHGICQQIADKDGWGKYLEKGQVSLGQAMTIIKNLRVEYHSWNSGEVIILSRRGNQILNITRPSYSNRMDQIYGPEPVGVLDITAIMGWVDENGNPFPVRKVMAMRCINGIIDLQNGFIPLAPLVKVTLLPTVTSPPTEKCDTFWYFYPVHDTMWMEKEPEEYTYRQNIYREREECFFSSSCHMWYSLIPVYFPVIMPYVNYPNITISVTKNYYNNYILSEIVPADPGKPVTPPGHGGRKTRPGHGDGSEVTQGGHNDQTTGSSSQEATFSRGARSGYGPAKTMAKETRKTYSDAPSGTTARVEQSPTSASRSVKTEQNSSPGVRKDYSDNSAPGVRRPNQESVSGNNPSSGQLSRTGDASSQNGSTDYSSLARVGNKSYSTPSKDGNRNSYSSPSSRTSTGMSPSSGGTATRSSGSGGSHTRSSGSPGGGSHVGSRGGR